ncbi:hypothetical protein JCGZ_10260 [Jatropha curcas]|uniref:Uncharacterized protein n=1 Tax=Jatropha curcas TaxID=180498 RepID=A0A067LNI2_JATCU|nr:hypothetical protein JCGZ_10260 [Jatropha curcas]
MDNKEKKEDRSSESLERKAVKEIKGVVDDDDEPSLTNIKEGDKKAVKDKSEQVLLAGLV